MDLAHFAGASRVVSSYAELDPLAFPAAAGHLRRRRTSALSRTAAHAEPIASAVGGDVRVEHLSDESSEPRTCCANVASYTS